MPFKTRLVPSLILLLTIGLWSEAGADPLALMATQTGQFGTLDLNNGTFAQLGNNGQSAAGLAVGSDGTLYSATADTGNLYQVDPANGTLSLVGTGSINYLSLMSTTSGLFAIGGQNALGAALSLYSINPTTGAATLIGPTGLSLSTTVSDTIGGGVSVGSNTLYFSLGPSFTSDALYTLSTSTGAATLIGDTGVDGLAAELYENGTLYGGSNFSGMTQVDALYTLNPTTGASTFVADVTSGTGKFSGLAPVPEPGTLVLYGCGLLVFAGLRHRT